MAWLPKKSVVVPVDFSQEAFAVIDTALELAEGPQAVHLVHMLSDVSDVDPAIVMSTVSRDVRTRHVVQALRERLNDPKYQALDIHVGFGDAGHEIVELAGKLSAELIVMPSHGRRGVSRMLIGSVAERVLRLAHCPVLVMRE